jgi:hypothetical protein
VHTATAFPGPDGECPRFGGFASRDDLNDWSSSSDCSEWNGALGNSGQAGQAGQVGEGGSHVHGDLSGTVVAGYRFRSTHSKISMVSRQTIPLMDTAHEHRSRTAPVHTATAFPGPDGECPRYGGFTSSDDLNDWSSSSDCSGWNGALGNSGQVREGTRDVHGGTPAVAHSDHSFRLLTSSRT